MTVFWDVASCSMVEIDWRFRNAYCQGNGPDDGGYKHLWNVGQFLRYYTHGSTSEKSYSYSLLWEFEISKLHGFITRKVTINSEFDVRFQVLTEASMKFRFVFWDVLPCKIIINRRFRGSTYLWIRAMSNRPNDGGSTYLWNVGWQLFYTAVHPRRQIWTSSESDSRVKRTSSRMHLSPMDEMSVKKQSHNNLWTRKGGEEV
jgi:hypothetical protein